jgi:hypothetical protein
MWNNFSVQTCLSSYNEERRAAAVVNTSSRMRAFRFPYKIFQLRSSPINCSILSVCAQPSLFSTPTLENRYYQRQEHSGRCWRPGFIATGHRMVGMFRQGHRAMFLKPTHAPLDRRTSAANFGAYITWSEAHMTALQYSRESTLRPYMPVSTAKHFQDW